MITSLMDHVISNLNNFPFKNSISSTISPATIVEGVPKPDFSHKRIAFGSYAIVWIRTTNDMKRRAVPAIALNQSNRQGGHYFMSLDTGKRIHSYHWDKVPIPKEVINRVEKLAKLESQPLLTNKQPMFEWSPGVPIISTIDDISDEIPHVSDTTLLDDSILTDSNVPIPDAHDSSLNAADGSSSDDVSFADDSIFPDEHALITDSSNDDISYSTSSSNYDNNVQLEERVPLPPGAVSPDSTLSFHPPAEEPQPDDNDNTSSFSTIPLNEPSPPLYTHDSSLSQQSFDDLPLTNEGADDAEEEISTLEDNDDNIIDTSSPPDNYPPPRCTQCSNAGTGVDRLQLSHGGKLYHSITDTQFLTMKQ